ncbi:MAG: phosphonate ABC transporter, permease protein PhnE [Trueperaceae bacterium]|nr:MAG: phosphonate ABC transporter, permease protein PhnE [Trueperaceae bacterium]
MAVPDRGVVQGPPARPVTATRFLNWGTWGAIAVLFAVSVQQTGFNLEVVGQGMGDFLRFFGRLAPDWRALPQIWGPLVETLQIAWLGTVFGTILGLPLIFLASFNTTINPPVMFVARSILTVMRSIPDLLYAAILAPILMIGPLPGVAALTLFTMAVLAKLASEAVESIDPGPLEALRAAGAGRNRMIVFAVLPQIGATLTSFILYVFEINVRASVIIGLVGAGGIGNLINRYLSFFDYSGLGTLLIVVFGVVLAIDQLSVWLRSRLI